MSGLKQSLRLDLIPNAKARTILDQRHPFGAGSPFLLALGVFWDSRCEGVMSWGDPVTNNAVYRYGIRSREALELRKLWMSDVPPRNSESRALGVAVRLIRKHYPQLRLLLTYCETDEAAAPYKAAGWIPQGSNRYLREVELPDGEVISVREFNRRGGKARYGDKREGRYADRRKWVYPLDDAMAALVKQYHAPSPSGSRRCNSDQAAPNTNDPDEA